MLKASPVCQFHIRPLKAGRMYRAWKVHCVSKVCRVHKVRIRHIGTGALCHLAAYLFARLVFVKYQLS